MANERVQRMLRAVLSTLFLVASAHERRGARLLDVNRTPLRTNGRYIVDNQGERVKWACVNWYGAYSSRHAVGGLEVQPMQVIVDRIVELGFNCVRMMYSTQAYVYNPPVEDSTVAANPHLKGMRWQEIFDLTMQALTDAKLMVILNNHNSKSGWCCHFSQDEGLWYVPEYSEAVWVESLVNLTHRYKDNRLVVAIDLRNEVHDYEDTHLTWGDGNPKTDWAAAATRAGNAVLATNPDVIIVVMAMCFGLDLRPMRNKPVQLSHPNRVVYQTHNYLEYQIFDNVSKMLMPWRDIRKWTLLVLALLLLLDLGLLRSWVVLGRPRPPTSCIILSTGLWIFAFSFTAAVISWSIYQFGMKFCAIAMRGDVLPWFVGSVLLGTASLLISLPAAWRLRKRMDAPSTGPPPKGLPPCCTPRLGSWRRAFRCHREDVKWLANRFFRLLGRDEGFSCDSRERCCYAEWDAGLTVGLQCAVLSACMAALLVFLYIWAHILPTYWWMERHLDGLWGFALEQGLPFTAPVWMGEFGQEVRGEWWLNFVRYLSIRDVDFAYWAINGIKWAEGKIDVSSGNFVNYEQARWENETFGILSHDYTTVRHPWKLLDLQGLMDSPARWTPDTFPCRRDALGPSCGAR
mmetsp:Transcript_61342/g.142737  ORF Transcript_61342/g.142737 Transcript_61342/m.142737 type:complete len:630 (-) Transcript_61342:145-2034(-)